MEAGCMKRAKSNRDGFTLAEFMVASVIFMIVSLAFTYGMISAMKAQVMATDYYRSTSVARNRIQHAKCVEFSSLGLLVENRTQVDNLGNQNSTGTLFRTTTVTNITTNQVDVTVDVYYIVTDTGRTSNVPVTIRTKIANGM
jgi:type II secretory pathway pseudopilin PulG